ncbi:MAG: membrane integrity-associated transporter subunit PqiC [Dehalococcoidales bacterium]|nr:membrane integrity-associated transporter subunit PqiC [Dehalococcoidales bacterium]
MRIAIRFICLLLTAVVPGSCSIVPGDSPQSIYRLPRSAISLNGDKGVEVSLRIARPLAGGVLDSARIVVVPEQNNISVYPNVRWNSTAPVLIRDHLLDAFHNDGRIRRLSSDSEGLHADYELGGTLRSFQSEYRDGVPQVVISIDARMIDAVTQRIVAARRFTVIEGVKGTQVAEVVAAFGRASDALARELISWTLRLI